MSLGLNQPIFLGDSTTLKKDDSLKCGLQKNFTVFVFQKKTLQILQCSRADFFVPKGKRKVHTPKVWFDANIDFV